MSLTPQQRTNQRNRQILSCQPFPRYDVRVSDAQQWQKIPGGALQRDSPFRAESYPRREAQIVLAGPGSQTTPEGPSPTRLTACITSALLRAVASFRANAPAVVGTENEAAVHILSLATNGMPWYGLRRRPSARCRSKSDAVSTRACSGTRLLMQLR